MVTGAASVGRVVTDIDLTISRATKEVVAATINNVIVRRDVKPAAPDLTALIDKYGDHRRADREPRHRHGARGADPHPERGRRVVARRHHRRRPAVGDLRAELAGRERRSGRHLVHELRRDPGRHQRRADHLRRGVQRPAVRQRAGHDGHDRARRSTPSWSSSSQGGNGVLQIPASLTYDRSQPLPGRQPRSRTSGSTACPSTPRRRTGSRSTTSSPTVATTTAIFTRRHQPVRRRDRPRRLRPLRRDPRHRQPGPAEPHHAGAVGAQAIRRKTPDPGPKPGFGDSGQRTVPMGGATAQRTTLSVYWALKLPGRPSAHIDPTVRRSGPDELGRSSP